MVDAIEPDDLVKLEALAIHDGWGEENQRIASLCAEIHNAALFNAAKMGGSVKPEDLRTYEDFMPRFKWQKKRRRRAKPVSDATLELSLKKLAGF